jgi:hypothetical protein
MLEEERGESTWSSSVIRIQSQMTKMVELESLCEFVQLIHKSMMLLHRWLIELYRVGHKT